MVSTSLTNLAPQQNHLNQRAARLLLLLIAVCLEEDGNFHEPVFSIEGDGIGYFGSAVPDTV